MLGRFFDYHLLDMIELGIDKYTPMAAFKVRRAAASAGVVVVHAGLTHGRPHDRSGALDAAQTAKFHLGSKHSMVFNGEAFETKEEFKQLKSILLGTRGVPSQRGRGGRMADRVCARSANLTCDRQTCSTATTTLPSAWRAWTM